MYKGQLRGISIDSETSFSEFKVGNLTPNSNLEDSYIDEGPGTEGTDQKATFVAQADFEKDYSEVLSKIGGFGLYQYFVVITIISGVNSTTFMYNCLGYLELQP